MAPADTIPHLIIPFVACDLPLLYPAGIRHPCETKFDNHLQDLEHSNYTLSIPLIPTTPEEMEDMFRLCSHVRFKIPQQVRSTLETWIHLLCTNTAWRSARKSFRNVLRMFEAVSPLLRFFKDWSMPGNLTTPSTRKVSALWSETWPLLQHSQVDSEK